MAALVYKSALLETDLLDSGPSPWVGHIPFAFWITEQLQPRILVELGAHYGHSYFSFCQGVLANGLSTKCYAVDTWQGDEHAGFYGEEVFAAADVRNQRMYHAFSWLLRMPFDEAVTYFSDSTIDLLHIDGLHTYEAVRHDFEMWLPKLSSRGVILFHDINVRERGFGVWRLWEELSTSYPHIEFEHSHGLGVLFVGGTQPTGIMKLLEEWSTPEGRHFVKHFFAKLGQLVSLEYQANNLNQAVAERDGQIADLNQAVAERDGQIADLNQAVVERDGQIADLNQAVAERDARFAAILNSTSWAITRPVRLVGDQLKHMRSSFRLMLQIMARACKVGLRLAKRLAGLLLRHDTPPIVAGIDGASDVHFWLDEVVFVGYSLRLQGWAYREGSALVKVWVLLGEDGSAGRVELKARLPRPDVAAVRHAPEARLSGFAGVVAEALRARVLALEFAFECGSRARLSFLADGIPRQRRFSRLRALVAADRRRVHRALKLLLRGDFGTIRRKLRQIANEQVCAEEQGVPLGDVLVISKSLAHCRNQTLQRRLAELTNPTSGWHSIDGTLGEAPPRVTVSVVTFNSAAWLSAFVASLEHQNYPLACLEVVFVDNGSTDDTLALIAAFQQRCGKHFAAIQLHRLPNPGFGAAHNHAVRHGQSEFVLVTNPDLEFSPDAITQVVAMARHDREGVASWELRQKPYEHPKHYDPVSWETLWSSHACILIRRAVFEALGGYDERIFLYGEDVEFSFRCREAGYRLRYCPLAWVLHHTYETAHQVKPAQYLGSIRANLFLRLRYGSGRDIAAGPLLALASLQRAPFPGARRRLLKEYLDLLRQAPALLRDNRARSGPVVGIFHGFDYELARHGAFVAAPPLPAAEEMPLISVITRTYAGREWLLRQAGLSVLQQTWPNLEWIVVEDGGEQCRHSIEALAKQAPCPVRYANQEKLGRSAAGNLGLAMAQGRWCLFLDDDDLLYADHLETLAGQLLADDSLAAAYSLAWGVSSNIDSHRQHIEELTYYQNPAHVQRFDVDKLALSNYIPIQAILFERRLFEQRGGFREHFNCLEDWNLWRRYAHGERFALVAKTTSLYRTPACATLSASRQAQFDASYQQIKDETDAELASTTGHKAAL